MRTIARITAALITVMALAGCESSNTIWVTGSLLKGGSPFTPPEGRSNHIVFIAMEVQDESDKAVKSTEPYAATLNPTDGTFEVPGPDGRGIPPGRYRIAVTQHQRSDPRTKPRKRGEKAFNRDTDLLKDQYGPTTSPIIRELNKSQRLTIDLDRPMESPP